MWTRIARIGLIQKNVDTDRTSQEDRSSMGVAIFSPPDQRSSVPICVPIPLFPTSYPYGLMVNSACPAGTVVLARDTPSPSGNAAVMRTG